ncbi:MAG: GGDEF domain-containing protein [Desulfamplus sp.]|nr:GGDEF domain-containing protein [Desulfamplus sp.]
MPDDQNREKHIAELTAKAYRLQSQKEMLLKELNKTEEALQATVNMYARYLPSILDYIQDQNSSFTASLKQLSTAIKNGEPTTKIEQLLTRVQTDMLKDAYEPTGQKGKASFISGLFKSAENGGDYLENLKKGYIDLVNSLKETIESSYTSKLNQITASIQSANNLDTITKLRDELFLLIQQYIYNLGADREKITAFVKEIVKRILQIEAGINSSYEHTNSSVQSSEEFGNLLNREIGELKNSVDVSDRLEDLKTHVSQTLSSIEIALKEKNAKDKAVKIMSEKSRTDFQAGFSKLKKELDQAIKHSKDLETKLNQDPLTKVYNRRAYIKRIENEMERFLRYQTIFSILVLDIDFFKKVNDTYGHAIGDKCLQEITKRTAPVLRKNDMFARYGGEEFVVVMPETPGDGAVVVAEKIRTSIEKIEFIYKSDTIKMTVSIGVSQVRNGDKSHETVFERADAALYRAKSEGRNRVVMV